MKILSLQGGLPVSRSFLWWIIILAVVLALGVWLFVLGVNASPYAAPLTTAM